MCYFHPYLGKWSGLTNIFQMGWNHQLGIVWGNTMDIWWYFFIFFHLNDSKSTMVVSWIIQNLHTGFFGGAKYGAPGQSTQGPNQKKTQILQLTMSLVNHMRFLKHAMIRGGVQDVVILQWQGHGWSENVDGNLEQCSSTFQMWSNWCMGVMG